MTHTETRNFIAGEWCEGEGTVARLNPSVITDVLGQYAQAWPRNWSRRCWPRGPHSRYGGPPEFKSAKTC